MKKYKTANNNTLPVSVEDLRVQFRKDVSNFEGGKIQQSYDAWTELTSDGTVLETVSGIRVEEDAIKYLDVKQPQKY